MSVLIVILTISLLVIIHELGHFIAAKLVGARVEEFGFGYRPRLFKAFTWRGTEFTFNLIPIGGYVQLEGEHALGDESKTEAEAKVDDSQVGRPFYQLKSGKRLAVIMAGVVVNLVFALAAFTAVYSFNGIPTPLSDQARIGWIADQSPAAEAGLPVEANITQIKTEAKSYHIASYTEVQTVVSNHRGEVLTIVVETPGDQELELNQTEYQVYARTIEETPAGEGSLGVVFKDYHLKFYPWYQMPFRAVIYGVKQAVALAWLIISSLGQLVKDLLSFNRLDEGIAGPVGIVYQAQQGNLAVDNIWSVLGFAGMLSLNLAVMNILPIPALDGGRALFILLEKLFNQKKIQQIENYANVGGFVFLMLLVVVITVNDIIGIFK